MRTAIYLMLFFALLLTPFALRHVVGSASVANSSESGGGDRLVIVTPHSPDIRREFGWVFSDWHVKHFGSPVTLDFRAMSGTNNIKRLLQTTYDSLRRPDRKLPPEEAISDRVDVQIAWGGGDSFFNGELKPLGILAPLNLSPAQLKEVFPQAQLTGVNLYDAQMPPRWVGSCLSSFGIMFNPDLYDSLHLPYPQTWDDLANPKLVGMISLADPTQSGSVAVSYMMVIQHEMAEAEKAFLATGGVKSSPGYDAALAAGFKRGMGTLELMAANARYFVDSATIPPNDVAYGQAAAATAIDFYARVFIDEVGPERARFVTPANATAITPDPVAILYGTVGRKREIADHFVEFLLSPEGQRLWILKPGVPGGPRVRALRRPPIRRDVYDGDRSEWTDQVNPFTSASTFNMRGEWMGIFAEIRPIWSAAWIDDRDDLKRAYAAVLAVTDRAKREELLARLAEVPVSLPDVQADTAERKRLEAAGNADQWKAQRRIEWAEKFREHYRRVEEKAEGKK